MTSYNPPKGGLEIRITLTGPDGGTQTVSGPSIELGESPIVARPGDEVSYVVEDEDLIFDDVLASGSVRIQERHANGRAVHERLTLTGRCVER